MEEQILKELKEVEGKMATISLLIQYIEMDLRKKDEEKLEKTLQALKLLNENLAFCFEPDQKKKEDL